jgi:hypothetical protein
MRELPDRLRRAIKAAVGDDDVDEWETVTAHRLDQMLREGRSMAAAVDELLIDWSDIAARKEL